MGGDMRAVKIATVVMGGLILLCTAGLVVAMIVRRPSPPPPMAGALALVLDEPVGTSIVGVAAVPDRLAVALHGGGPDRVVLVDPRTGAVSGRISLRQ